MNKIAIAGACVVVAFWAGWFVNGWRLEKDIQKTRAEAIEASAKQYQAQTEKINQIAVEHTSNTDKLEAQITNLKKELNDAKKNHPLPSECRIDAGRLRVIRDAVTAANTAAGQ